MRKLRSFILAVTLCAMCVGQASALEYSFGSPEDYLFGRPSSMDTIYEHEDDNVDRSKDVALIPPGFGSPTSYLPGSGEYLTPNLVPGALSGGLVNAVGNNSYNGADIGAYPPVASGSSFFVGGFGSTGQTVGYTAVTGDLYYDGGHLGTLSIPAIGLDVKIYQGTSDTAMRYGVGHFEDTSIWAGNVALGGHNRGVNNYFGMIETLTTGAEIVLTTRLGVRTYKVISVEKISETNISVLDAAAGNCITLLTCVRDQSAYRWCVRGIEV